MFIKYIHQLYLGMFFVFTYSFNLFLIWGHGSAPAKSSKKAARPYRPFLEAIQAISDPPITSLRVK